VRTLLQLRRIGGTASAAFELSARLGFLHALEGPHNLRSRAIVLQQVARLLLDVHGIHVDERGAAPADHALLVANHVNYLDPLVVMSAHPALPVAKEEVRHWPVIGALCERAGVQFVARARAASGAAILRTMARTLREGTSILNFPEGTTSEGRAVLPLKPACFRVARLAGVAVVPVAIVWESQDLSWTGDASFLPHYLRVAGRQRIHVRVRWGAPLHATPQITDHDLAERARDFLLRAVQEPDGPAKCA
jgi:1-acyl-sn-glycerol-3-phosphate acyltransferase